jgi:hypothetical protein
MVADGSPVRRGDRRSRIALGAGLVALALASLVAAVTRIELVGHWHGLFLLRGKGGNTFEVKDDLVLGDGSRLLAGLQLASLSQVFAPRTDRGGVALDLDWDDRQGSGLVWNRLADGTDLVTIFARYEDSEGANPHGLFVGGALPDIVADPRSQNESGMSHHDARGWTHIWCNVNEAIWIDGVDRVVYPSEWRFLGSRVLLRNRERVVLESSHELDLQGRRLRMERFAYFKAGRPFFKLGIQLVNAGEVDLGYDYAYGDEPWVGDFGSAEGNVGWLENELATTERQVDPTANRWAGIVDLKTGAADFLAWVGGDLPDMVFFSNEAGAPRQIGRPLESNEVFIGLEWTRRRLGPGESRSMLLAIGMADKDPRTGGPRLPEGAGPNP